MPITTKVMSLIPAQARCTPYNIMWIKFVSALRQVSGFLRVLRFLYQESWPPLYNWNSKKQNLLTQFFAKIKPVESTDYETGLPDAISMKV